MSKRLPSITDTEDFRALAYALEHDGALPDALPKYVREALALADWLTSDGQLNDEGMDHARTWADVREQTAQGFKTGGPFTPTYLEP